VRGFSFFFLSFACEWPWPEDATIDPVQPLTRPPPLSIHPLPTLPSKNTPTNSSNFDVRAGPITSSWFTGASTNLAYNCLDRHVAAGHGDRIAFLWEGNDLGEERTVSYSQLLDDVCRIANWLKAQGVRPGDDVTLYMPMVPELPAVMLACARIGAVHSVVFAGFSASALAARITDSASTVVITTAAVKRGAKVIGLKAIVDEALEEAGRAGHVVSSVLVSSHAAGPGVPPDSDIPMRAGRDVWWADAIPPQPPTCPPVWRDAEDPLFKLYTSGSTGKPKGVLHTTGGYMVGAAATVKYVFDARPESDVYWCTADCGWITGHTYVTYGPLLNGMTQVLFEGVPTHPDPGRVWAIVEKYRVTQLYTAPTAIRALEAAGDAWVTAHDRSSLRILGSVGEPIGPQAWHWYADVCGDGRCPVVDTWWQTETGSHMITPLPGATPLKPGSASLPFFGVDPVLLDPATGAVIEGPGEGVLAIRRSWPSALRSLAGDPERFEATYFKPYAGYYFTGDGARRDDDGYYWLIGRVDDVINVSGHRIGTAEVEAALTTHGACAEAAVVPVDHPIKGQGIYAFVTLMEGSAYPPPESLKKELIAAVRTAIGPIAAPDAIHWAPGLPKTRSGKIMRRILRKIAGGGGVADLGDTSTLADPGVVDTLLALKGK
jgi:acetyl-CoA synthetase